MEKNKNKQLIEAKERMKKKKKSMKARLALPIMIVTGITVLTLGIFGGYMSYYNTVKSLEPSMVAAVNLAQQSIANKMNGLSTIVGEIGTHTKAWSNDVTLEDKNAFLEFRAKQNGFLGGYFFSKDGICLQDGTDYSNTDYFKASISGEAFITSPYTDEKSGQLVINVSAPIWENGTYGTTVVGVIMFKVPQSIINSMIDDIHISEHGAAYMIDKDGNALANVDVNKVLEKSNIEEIAKTTPSLKTMAELHAKARSGETGFGQYTYQGVKKFLSYSPVAGSDGWIIFLNAPQSDFTGGVTTTIYVSIGLMVLFLAINFLGSIYIVRGFANPVEIFVERLSKLAEGDVKSPLNDFDASTEEFEVLKNSLEKTLENSNAVIGDIDYLMDEMSNGNFDIDSQVPNKYVGDYTNILAAFKRMRKSITESFRSINAISEQVSDGAAQVSSGAQTLAQGATEQASSIEELSASITEISRSVNKNAEDAELASRLTEDAGMIMQGSLGDMESACLAMNEITATSKDISKVIKAIDDIAFQTNILALNAAVEAARAGTAGKGFAVVADEVRNLSQKSAEAAKNTTALIESSITAVEKGSALVNKTSTDFVTVAAKASEVNDLIKEISNMAKEQASAITQISIGIDQVSSVVQMNSATSEESAAASQELSSQAVVLRNLVDQFKLAEE